MNELSTVLVPDKVITALELFDVINECRARCGEKAKDRSNFLRALEQELEINLYDKSQKNFNDKINNLGGFGKGRRVKRNPDLTYEQALQMAMRESKLVRQAVIEILKRQQSELIALRAIEVIKDNALAAEYLADNQQPALAMERHTMAEREYKNTSRVHASELAKGRAVKRILKRSEIKIRALIQPDLFD
ncbi:hypothetical protein HVX39_08770 [Escherichia coli]|nr:hypothetical protein HVX39_08770 [Escherichia coli]